MWRLGALVMAQLVPPPLLRPPTPRRRAGGNVACKPARMLLQQRRVARRARKEGESGRSDRSRSAPPVLTRRAAHDGSGRTGTSSPLVCSGWTCSASNVQNSCPFRGWRSAPERRPHIMTVTSSTHAACDEKENSCTTGDTTVSQGRFSVSATEPPPKDANGDGSEKEEELGADDSSSTSIVRQRKRHSAPPRAVHATQTSSRTEDARLRRRDLTRIYAARFAHQVRIGFTIGAFSQTTQSWQLALGKAASVRDDERWSTPAYWQDGVLDRVETLLGKDGFAQLALLFDAFLERQAAEQRRRDAAAKVPIENDWAFLGQESQRFAAMQSMPPRLVVCLLMHISYLNCNDETATGLYSAFGFTTYEAQRWCTALQPLLFLRLLTSDLYTTSAKAVEYVTRLAEWSTMLDEQRLGAGVSTFVAIPRVCAM